jgi:hypothetical protein
MTRSFPEEAFIAGAEVEAPDERLLVERLLVERLLVEEVLG